MRAIVMTGYGGKDVIASIQLPEPSLGDDQVLVEVAAAGLNPVDLKIRAGVFKRIRRYRFPQIMGNELAGVVSRVGRGVTRFKVGDRVFALVQASRLGACAEQCAVPERDLALVPANLSLEDAASLPLVGLTAYQALHDHAALRPGQRLFVKAGSGGLGTLAVQLAKAIGAEVTTSTSGPNVEWVRALGADRVIDYTRERFENVLSDYDVVLDSVDGDRVSRGFSILKPGGHLISLVGPPNAAFARAAGLGIVPQLVFRMLSRKQTRLAKARQTQYTFFLVRPSGEQLSALAQLVTKGKLRPVVDRTYAMDDVKEALDYLATGRAKGKVVLRIGRGEEQSRCAS
jgi:NADPH:quinone reductase-like Zn-dependent oxidoreductase